ncbi:MAG: transposase family protein [Anaerolineales bacterium]
MTRQSKLELLAALRPRYKKANKKEKGRILDQFCAATGYNRKYAIDLMRHGPHKGKGKKQGRRRRYGPDVIAVLVELWQISSHLCGKRLQPFLPELVEVLERHGELRIAADTREKLLQMSPATIDRRLAPARSRIPLRGRTTTKPGTLLKTAIPIRTYTDWDDALPGFLEIDLVAHCGETTAGEYLHTLSAVDIATRWHEAVALPNRSQQATMIGVQTVRYRLPFALRGLDSDNGGEFINYHLFHYCEQEQITFTRSRPYKKNDQAHVEQKNWSPIRQMIGYDRYESREALDLLQAIYEDLRLYVNFFQPVMKLESKTRSGSRVRKRYDRAQTPFRRVLASKHVPQSVKDDLTDLYLTLNPVELKRRIDANLERLWKLPR